MSTDSDRQGAGGHAGEGDGAGLRGRYDALYLKFMRLSGTFRADDELPTINALRDYVLAEGVGVEELAEALAVFAVRAQRQNLPWEGHPTQVAARRAVDADLRGDTRAAAELVAEALKEQPGTLPVLVMAWGEAYERHATGGRLCTVDASLPMIVVHPETGALVKEAEQGETVRWAGEVLRAYLNDQANDFDFQLRQVTTANAHELLPTLLRCVTQTMKGLPDGWALMGSIGGGADA